MSAHELSPSTIGTWVRRAARAAACTAALAAGMGSAAALDSMGVFSDQISMTGERTPGQNVVETHGGSTRSSATFQSPEPDAKASILPEADWSKGASILGGTTHRLIHFTFDDGPNRMTTPHLLDELDRLEIKATFFVTTGRMASPGSRAAAERDILRDIAARGHSIGNHTITHRQLPLLSPSEVLAEVNGASDLIESVTGIRPHLIRPPGGSRSPRINATLAQHGLTQVLWNLGSGDFRVRSADEVVTIFRRVLARREREHGELGGIVLLHDTHPWSVAALPKIVDYLERRNCDLVESDDELFDIIDDATPFFTLRSDSGEDAPIAEPATAWIESRQQTLRLETERRCGRIAVR